MLTESSIGFCTTFSEYITSIHQLKLINGHSRSYFGKFIFANAFHPVEKFFLNKFSIGWVIKGRS